MLIVCPQCAASYQVTPASLGLDGRSVRCANCHTIWFASPVEPALEDSADTASALFAAGQEPVEPPAFADFAADRQDDFPAFGGNIGSEPPSREDSDIVFGAQDHLSADASPLLADDAAHVSESLSIVPPIEDASADLRQATPLPGEDIESLAARREAQRLRGAIWYKLKQKLRMPGLPTIIVALGGIVLVLFAARHQVVRYAPQTASFYALFGMPVNLRGLDFENIRVTRTVQDGIPVLVVEGKITATTAVADVPRLRFAIHDQSGKEIYTWSMMPSRSLLASGESLPFRSRLASPPAEGHNVSIRFFNRRDAISGFR